MGVAWGLPDVRFYLDMAQGHAALVPQPFTSRPLAPLLVRVCAFLLHLRSETCFAVLAILSICITVLVVLWLLLRSGSVVWFIPALVVLPFWPQMLGNAGLPDPLYTALLAMLLLALGYRRLWVAALLIFPLMLTRESTWLTLACLLFAGRKRWRGGELALAVGSAALGAWAVHRWSASGLPNPEHLSGSVYMLGKLVSNSVRSAGIVPWSNVYPSLCKAPVWQMPFHLGGVRSVGVCFWDPIVPLQAGWAILTLFGVLPLLYVAVLPGALKQHVGGNDVLMRFCLAYGTISLLVAPMLGTWYTRLVGYAWPLMLVALPRALARPNTPSGTQKGARTELQRWAALLLVHLLLCVIGTWVASPAAFVLVVLLYALALALILRRSGLFRAALT
ncbi:MAG: hypothetical protein INR62_06240 [Rhodospirillales bacterium]|nr:hypothetical protein [Acetobacter sp.]